MSESVTQQLSTTYKRRIWVTALVLALQPAVVAQTHSVSANNLDTRLAALLAKVPIQTQVGLVVLDVADGRLRFAHQPDKPLKPASLMKLLVSAAALEQFGPKFRYTTRAFVHDGDLLVIGAGDPALGDERLAQRHGRAPAHLFDDWALALKTRGIESLHRIVLDDSIFERQSRHPDWPIDQSDRWYQAPVGSLNFNDNCLDARAELHDGLVRLVLQPELPPTFIANSLTIGERHKPILRRRFDSDVFEFVGTMKHSINFGPASVRRPTVFFGYALKRALITRGIKVRGEVVRRTILPAARAAAVPLPEYSTRLTDVLWRCNTFSQNLFAECLLKSLTAYKPDGSRSGRPGSWKAGTQRVRLLLTDLGVDMNNAVLRDGSGLSHSNRLTAAQIARLLVQMHRHRHRTTFIDSLALPGEEGSMRNRYADSALRGRLHGKTGSLNGVRSLAGYVICQDNTRLAFALLCNGKIDAQLPMQVVRILVESGSKH